MARRPFVHRLKTRFDRGNLWHVIGVREQVELKGTYLPETMAIVAMREGMYENGLTIKIDPAGSVGYIVDGKLISDADDETVIRF